MPERYHDWEVECPYCGLKYQVESEDISGILESPGGKDEECSGCGKEYHVDGEATPHFWTTEKPPTQGKDSSQEGER